MNNENRNLIDVEGFVELNEKLKKLANDKDKKGPLLQVIRSVARGTVNVAKREAPISKKPHVVSGRREKKIIDPGNLKESIGIIKGRRGKSRINPTLYVGPIAGGWRNDGFYGAWVEYGHKIKNKSGRSKAFRSTFRSKTKPNPFMQRAYDKTVGKVTPEVAEKVSKVIQRNIDKLSK